MVNFKVSANGFTLIELLVVLVIIGLGLSVVGGLGYEQLEQSKARAERLELETELKSFSHRAFHRADTVTIDFEGAEYRATFEHLDRQPPPRRFSYLTFPKQSIYFGTTGLPDRLQLEGKVGENTFSISLYPLIGFAKDDVYAKP